MIQKISIFLLAAIAFIVAGKETWRVAEQPKRIRLNIPAADIKKGNTFEFPAGTRFPGARISGDAKEIPQQLLPDGYIRFYLPPEAKNIMLYFGRDSGVKAESAEVFADFIAQPERLLQSVSSLHVSRHPRGGLLVKAPFKRRWIEYTLYRDFPVPKNAAGKGIVLEANYQSLSKMGWSSSLVLEQLDKNGRSLPGGAIDPRHTTMALPPNTPVRYRLPGRLSPEAAAIRIRFRLMASSREFDLYGRPLKNGADAMPNLWIRHLSVRTGETLDARPLNPEIYTERGMRLNGDTGFFYNTFPQAVWAEFQKIKTQKQMFWPLGAGTVEFRLQMAPQKNEKKAVLYCAHNRTRRKMQSLTYDFAARTATLSVTPIVPEEDDPYAFEKLHKRGRKVGKEMSAATFPLELPSDRMLHLAVSWDLDGKYRCFLNGKLAGMLETKPLPAVDPSKFKSPDQFYPDTVSFGMPHLQGLMTVGRKASAPFLCGTLGVVRISAENRYRDKFTPPAQITADERTVAFFDFSRFDRGVSGMSGEAVPAGIRSVLPPLAEYIDVELRDGGRERMMLVPDLRENVNPQKVLSALNYPGLPNTRVFNESFIRRSAELTLRPGVKKTFSCPSDVFMESVTLFNRGKKTLKAPFLLLDGEVDPRSYGDIADSMKLEALPPHERIVALFQLLLRSEDYFISHPVEFDPYSGRTHGVEYRAMSMFNGYCAFECGPLNNLAVNLFVNVGRCPANQTAGYEHSFEQVFYNGKMHLYDLSAQNFFPSRDQESAASLEETERDPFLFSRCAPAAAPRHFIRHGRRGYELHNLQYQERRSFDLRPGESFQACWFNNGTYNDLQTGISRYYPRFVKGTDETGAADPSRVGTIERPFPHYNSGFFRFDGKPDAEHPAFSERDEKSFRYRVESPYPVVSGRYRAEKKDGGFAEIQVSDDGKSWRAGQRKANGDYDFGIGVRARQKFQVRVNAPLSLIRRFSAETCVQMNPRLTTVNLKKGSNLLHYKSDTPDAEIQVVLRYRQRSSELPLPGGACNGAAPELARQYYAFDSNGSLKLSAAELPANAVCTVSDGFAIIRNGEQWVVTASAAGVGCLSVRSGEREREALLIAAPGLRIVYADAIDIVGSAFEKIGPDADYPGVRIRALRSHVKLPIRLGALNGKEYFLFTLLRPVQLKSAGEDNNMLWIRCGKKAFPMAFAANWASEFKKARYGTDRARFKWDFPVDGIYPSQWIMPLSLPTDGVIEPMPLHRGVEIAAVMAIPRDDRFAPELIKALCGLNWAPWRTR